MQNTSENMHTIPEISPSKINYAFFTNEDGESDAGYLIADQKTRNVNIYSSEQQVGKGHDPADRVLANIQKCFEQLGADDSSSHKFFMTSYYANMGQSEPLIVSCDNMQYLNELKASASENLFFGGEDKASPKRLGLEPNMCSAIKNSGIAVIRADALIFKGIPGETIAVLGASGDAHPIMMFDDTNQIACYIAGAHMTIKQGVLEQSFAKMVAMGAEPNAIRLVIGPGLGAKSYEFGANAPDYFSIPEAHQAQILQPVMDTLGNKKFLIRIKELVAFKLSALMRPEYIHNIDLDTMGFDLYDDSLNRKTLVNFKELNKSGPLFFGARRGIMEQSNDAMKHNPGAYNTVGRHGAGFSLS